MRAIILAAGRGLRLQQTDDRQMPKCLGSMLTLHTVADAVTRGGDVLLMVEIDFPTDVVRAAHEVLPQLQPLSGASP
jgi:choline kinase